MVPEKRNRLWSNIIGSVFALIFLFFFHHLGYDVGSVVMLAIVDVVYILLCFLFLNVRVRVEIKGGIYAKLIYLAFLLVFIVVFIKLTFIGNIFLWASALLPVLCYPRLINLYQFIMIGLWYVAFAGFHPVAWMIFFAVLLTLRVIQFIIAESLGREV